METRSIVTIFFILVFSALAVAQVNNGGVSCNGEICDERLLAMVCAIQSDICGPGVQACNPQCGFGGCCKLPAACGDTYGFGTCSGEPPSDDMPACAIRRGVTNCCSGMVTHPFPAGYSCPPGMRDVGCEIISADPCSCTTAARITCEFDCTHPLGYPWSELCGKDPKPCQCEQGYCDPNGNCIINPCHTDGDCPEGECVEGTCQPCDPAVEVCDEGCTPGEPNCCNDISDCPEGTYCTEDGTCIDICENPPCDPCTTDSECPEGECVDGICIERVCTTGPNGTCNNPNYTCCGDFCVAKQCINDNQCDDRNPDTTDRCETPGFCTGQCRHYPTTSTCGDGIREGMEECESNLSCPAGEQCNLTGANPTCQCEPVIPPGEVCGNGRIEGNEDCDPAGSTCANGKSCTTTCQCPTDGPGCGNGRLDGIEECDLSAPNAAYCYGNQRCNRDCTCPKPPIACGDGIWNAGEQCDPGTPGHACPTDYTCTETCTCIPDPPVCGNNIREVTEQCDPPGSLCTNGTVCENECSCGIVDANTPSCTILTSEPHANPLVATVYYQNFSPQPTGESLDCGNTTSYPLEECRGTPNGNCRPVNCTYSEDNTYLLRARVTNNTQTAICHASVTFSTQPSCRFTATSPIFENETSQLAVTLYNYANAPSTVQAECGNGSRATLIRDRMQPVGGARFIGNCGPFEAQSTPYTAQVVEMPLCNNAIISVTNRDTRGCGNGVFPEGDEECEYNPDGTLAQACSNGEHCGEPNSRNECQCYSTSVTACGNGVIEPGHGEECDPDAEPTGCPTDKPICASAGEENACKCQPLGIGPKLAIKSIVINPLSLSPGNQLNSIQIGTQNIGNETCNSARAIVTITDPDHRPLPTCSTCRQETRTPLVVNSIENKTLCFTNDRSITPCDSRDSRPEFDTTQTGTYGVKVEVYCENTLSDTKFAFFSIGNPGYTPIPEIQEIFIVLIGLASIALIYYQDRKKSTR